MVGFWYLKAENNDIKKGNRPPRGLQDDRDPGVLSPAPLPSYLADPSGAGYQVNGRTKIIDCFDKINSKKMNDIIKKR